MFQTKFLTLKLTIQIYFPVASIQRLIPRAPFFHPPEVRKSKGNYGPGIDIWALGINLYMLATGKKPGNLAYKLLRKIDLKLILNSPKGQELSLEHQNLIKDVNGKLLMDTIGKDLLHLICLMLTINPEQRPSAAILLTHPVFLKAKFNLDFIPIRNAEQLGIIVKPMKKHAMINLRPGIQIVSVPIDMQISLQERLNQQREVIQKEHGVLIDNTVHGLLSNHGRENVQSYVNTLGLADNLIDFLTPVDEVRIEYLNALNIIIEFLKLENVRQFVDKKNILKSLSEVGVQYIKDQPEMSNVALNILFEIAKHGIKLGQGIPLFTITVQNFAQLMESVKAGNKKSIEDINIAIISLEHILNHTTIPNIKDYLRIIENLAKYLSLNELVQNKYIVNALELLSTIANSTLQMPVFAAVVNVMSGPIIDNIRSSQIRRYEVDIIEKIYTIEIVLAQNGNRFDGIELPGQQYKISPFLILPKPTEKENIINSLISQSSSNQDSQYQSYPSLQDQKLIVSPGHIQLPDLIPSPLHIPSARHSPIISSYQLNQQKQRSPSPGPQHTPKHSPSPGYIPQTKHSPARQEQLPQSPSEHTPLPQQITSPSNLSSPIKRLKRIGKGGFATIWLAQEISTNKLVALKKMDYETQNERDQVNQEIRIHKESYDLFYQSAHSQSVPIVEPLGFFLNEDNSNAYFVMEYCENGDLWGYIKNMKMSGTEISENDAWEIISQICSIAHQLYSHRLIYGDFKPANLLLTKDNQIKICDFGLSQKMIEGKDSIDFRGGTL
ncbi:MAG: hypothetical protein EZS28_018694, partial [Streblomastix strix]